MAPTVTLGLITYNATDTVMRALASARAQEGIEAEIVVVDDCSSDDTLARLEAAARGDEAIRVFASPVNGGAAVARNRVIAEAKGAFIVFFDDDDESAPDRAARQIARIRTVEAGLGRPAPVLCHSARAQHYPDGTIRTEHTMGEDPDGPIPAGLAVARRILMGAPLPGGYGSLATCSQAGRTAVYRALGGFDPAFRRSEDTEFAIRASRAGAHFAGIGAALVTQTMTPTSDKSLAGERRFKRMLIEKHADLFESARHLRFCLEWTEARADWLAGDRAAFARRMAGLALTHPILSARRGRLALPNFSGNRAFARFHQRSSRP
ncbi:glycosyltransferase family 2 protein [Pelagibacterium montanilacus]|uniref:glycosyltransferase family 2 protein n=1 Tax=Pelagibacterium montanilacus TaxID=2185280 RepID=UPI0013DE9290|nr:glycosyltransferase [Pelagibacterium montanilacus]